MTTETTIAPVVKTLTVDCSVEHAFATFTERIADWWPLRTHSVGDEQAEGVRVEPGVDGRIVEQLADGTETVWAYMLDWDPPERLRFSWHPGRDRSRTRINEATEVEVTFTPAGDGTRVELVHRGWERLGERGLTARGSYDSGWDPVLDVYREAASR